MPIAIFYREELKEYDFGSGHPFHGQRAEIVLKFIKEIFPKESYQIIKAEPATDKDLLLICQKNYIDFTREYFKAANLGLDSNNRFCQYHSFDNKPIGRPGKIEEAARIIVGQAKKASDLIQGGEFKKAVSLGGGLHHAKSNFGEGFCLYNDVAFAGKYLIEKHNLERILILDTDAHAGNGTAEYFYEDPRVLFIDIHQDPQTLYPGTGFWWEIGSGKGRGYTVNLSLPPGAGGSSYQYLFDKIIFPLTEKFRP